MMILKHVSLTSFALMQQTSSEVSATDKSYFCTRKPLVPMLLAMKIIPVVIWAIFQTGSDRLCLLNSYIGTTDFYFIHEKKKNKNQFYHKINL